MANQSPTTLIGNVTSDPELKFTAQGTAKLGFSIAVNHYWTDNDGEKKEDTSFFNVTCWRYVAEDTANVLEKGMGVIVHGRLDQRSYEDKEGQKRNAIELVADAVAIQTRSIESLERKRRSAGNDGAESKAGVKSPRKTVSSAKAAGSTDEPF
jgi:single-strand DNA-binding protein